MPEVTELWSAVRFGGPVGVFAWLLVWLLRRGDDLQKENIKQLIKQRDHFRERAETAEREREEFRQRTERAESELARRLALDTGEIPMLLEQEDDR